MYSYINNIGNNIYCKTYDDNDKPQLIKDNKFKPRAYIADRTLVNSKYKGYISDVLLREIIFDNVFDYKDYIKEQGETRVYGHLGGDAIINQYIYRKKLSDNKKFHLLNNYFIDIETLSFKEFPDAINVKYPISAICTVRSTDRETRLWGLRADSMHAYKKKSKLFSPLQMLISKYPEMKKYDNFKDCSRAAVSVIKGSKDKVKILHYKEILKYIKYTKNIIYKEFTNDADLLEDFIGWVSETNIDSFVGYNSELYDMPYIFNRTIRLHGEDMLKKMSPFGVIRKTKHKTMKGDYIPSYDIVGITLIDYMNLFKKYVKGQRPSWKLKDIANDELGHSKIEHEDETFWEFYHGRPQVYFEYNIVDTDLLYLMDKKLNYIATALGMVHLCHLDFRRYEQNTMLWDGYLASFLRDMNMIIPPMKRVDARGIEGAYNKQPVADIYDWVVSFDLNSLYPHLIMQYNLSPETYVPLSMIKDKKLLKLSKMASEKVSNIEPFPHSNGVDLTLNNEIDYEYISSHDLIMTPSGSFFRADVRGIAPIVMENNYNDRKILQKKSNELYNLIENESDKNKKAIMKIEADIIDNEQYVIKIFLNSFYGAFLKDTFRYYNSYIGESITSAGQLSIRFIIDYINDFINEEIDTKDKDFVVGSSTDSMYICLADKVNKQCKNKSLSETIDWLFKYADDVMSVQLTRGYHELADRCHAFENKMKMGREVIADRAFWLNKRFYALRIFSDDKVKLYHEPKIKIVGFPIVKSTTPKKVKPIMKKMIEMILDRQSGRKIYSVLSNFKNEFFKIDYREISIPSTVNFIDKNISEKSNKSNFRKNLQNFKQGKEGGTHENAKGAIVFNNLIDKYELGEDKKISEGDKAKFIFLKEPNPSGIKYIAFDEKLYDEFNLVKYVDHATQFHRVIGKIMTDALVTLGLNWKSTWKNKRSKR